LDLQLSKLGVELMAYFNAGIELAAIAFVMALVFKVVQKKMMGSGFEESQKQMKEQRKKMNELLKKDDEQSKKELKKLQEDMMSALNKMTSKNMKYMVITIPVYLVLYSALIPIYEKDIINFVVPLTWFWYYVVVSIISSLAIGMIMSVWKKRVKNG
jgi:uncharacterized membrane protein (DUF106 family)